MFGTISVHRHVCGALLFVFNFNQEFFSRDHPITRESETGKSDDNAMHLP
jgi:hypothetical protein